MKTLLPIALICLASSVFAQDLPLPPSPTNALSGSAFAHTISELNLQQRDEAVEKEVIAGNIPSFLRHFCPVTVTNISGDQTNIGTFYVAPDYLAIGQDDDYLLMPVSPNTAQRIADRLHCLLPTRKMVNAIYATATVKLAPSPIPPDAAMTTVPVFLTHNEMVRAQRAAFLPAQSLGALVAGDKKDVVISARLPEVTNKVAIYGWQQTNGFPIQPLYLGHAAWWVDYSQCIRLVWQTMQVNGGKKSVTDVLADPELCGLLSDEGVITNARYPINEIAPAKEIPSSHPSRTANPSQLDEVAFGTPDFVASPYFSEWNWEMKLADDVRILINSPLPKPFASPKPVLLIFYALPNGNTIEETMGKKTRPGDDWHFEIQHIGAQTRWLHQVLTNQTVVVAYLEADTKSWPAWRKTHSDQQIEQIVGCLSELFPTNRTDLVLTSHSGGGSFIFGYLNTVTNIPSGIKRIAFLDSDYNYNTAMDAAKLRHWLAASPQNHLCVLAYQDYLARLNGKPFVSKNGGTWGRSQVMLYDLESQFQFNCRTNRELEVYSTPDGRVEFLLRENPKQKILHTVQVERNGFIQSILSGTPHESVGYEYLGERAYTRWIQGNN